MILISKLLIKTAAEQDNSSVEGQVENTKKLIDAISEIKE